MMTLITAGRPARTRRARLAMLGLAALLAWPAQAQDPRQRGGSQAVPESMTEASMGAAMPEPAAPAARLHARRRIRSPAPEAQALPFCGPNVHDKCIQRGARPPR